MYIVLDFVYCLSFVLKLFFFNCLINLFFSYGSDDNGSEVVVVLRRASGGRAHSGYHRIWCNTSPKKEKCTDEEGSRCTFRKKFLSAHLLRKNKSRRFAKKILTANLFCKKNSDGAQYGGIKS